MCLTIAQWSLFDRYPRRIVVPSVRRATMLGQAAKVGSRMNPVFKGVEVAHSLGMVSVAVDQLGEHVASLADKGQVIADALDELLVRS